MTTIAFFPEAALGPTNNCVGIGDVLRRRGHRVVFIVEASYAGTLAVQGFEERLVRLAPAPETEQAPGQFWKDFIAETAPVFRTSTLEQLESFIAPTMAALVDGARYVDEELHAVFDELRPDVVVEDNVCAFPALPASGIPWVRIASCNPAEIPDPQVPPVFSGLPAADRSGWDEFRAEFRRTHAELHASFDAFSRERGAPPLPELEFIHTSAHANLYVYPAEADYARERPLSAWTNLEASVRATETEPYLPPEGEGPHLYLSLGSLGSADVGLMQTLIDELSRVRCRATVSLGPRHDELRLAPNMTGAEVVPQTAVLPTADLVITHGGNNTVTESLFFGKPMVVLPLFWDQHDNAQRMDETGFGRRLSTYGHDPAELTGAIDALLADEALARRLAALSQRLRARPGTERAADAIERVARG